MIDELFSRAWASALPEDAAPIAHPIPPLLDPLNYEAGRFIDPKLAQSKNGWTLGIPDWKSLPGDQRSRFTSIPMLSASEPGPRRRWILQAPPTAHTSSPPVRAAGTPREPP